MFPNVFDIEKLAGAKITKKILRPSEHSVEDKDDHSDNGNNEKGEDDQSCHTKSTVWFTICSESIIILCLS